ncbi:nucleotidyltransferase family protein [Ferrovibrio xuzhouensis]|uniref:Nucleotidyltransferase family protein n=1 Tax=Ferrovibrio xuzhouensis TaxID=1576914 RepID=A0ABV7VGZ5_9PROT
MTPDPQTLILPNMLTSDAGLMAILRAVRGLGLPDWAVGAGAIRNRIWDRLFGLPDGPLADIDVLFFDAVDTTSARERSAEAALTEVTPGLPWSVRNQARMHLRNGDAPYRDTADAVAHWLETPTAVAARLEADDGLTLIAPHGAADLLAGRVRPTPRGRDKPGEYRARIAAKGWQRRWPELVIEGVT